MQLSVLVADDNPVNRELVAYFLAELRCTVVSVEDGEQAVDAYKSQQFDILLLDVQMPKLTGPQATQKIREYEGAEKKRTPILAITGYTQELEIQSFLATGMDDHMAKPITLEKLRNALRKWCPQLQ